MPQVAIVGDASSGGGVFVSSSNNIVKAGGKDVLVVGDILPSCTGTPADPGNHLLDTFGNVLPFPNSSIIDGSSTVNVRGKSLAFIGSNLSCGHVIVANNDPKVNAGS